MRCPDCGKFVPYDTEAEPEENSGPEFDGQTLTASYDRVLNCEQCGTELKRGTIDFEVYVDFTHEGDCSEDDQEYTVDVTAEPTTDTNTTDRHGKPITNQRYMATLYGIQLSGTVRCDACGVEADVDYTESLAASAMDESV